jgi:hypothetical protein
MNATQQITINYQPSESSQVAAWGYHAESKTLGVKFHGKAGADSTYHYFDVPANVAAAMACAESLGKFVGTTLRGKFAYERQPDEPGGIVFGLPQKQEPKYTASSKTGRLVNRSTGIAIPDDEPVMVFRAKDKHAIGALMYYLQLCDNPDHRAVVKSRIQDFQAFAAANPERMKEPDSSLQDVAVANVGRAAWPFPENSQKA